MTPTVRLRPWGWTVRIGRGKRRREKAGFGHGEEGRARAQAFADECVLAEAEAARAELRSAHSALPLDELLRDWVRTYAALRSERTRITDKGRVARLVAFFGSRDARSLTTADVSAFASSVLEAGRSASVAIGCLSILRRILNLETRAGRLPRNPVPEIHEIMRACRERGRSEEAIPAAWSRAEVAAILGAAAEAAPEIAGPLRFAFATGARRGELLALRWEDVDQSRRRVAIRRTLRAGSQGTKAPKAGRSRFTPLSPEIRELLARELKRQRRAQLEGRDEPEWVWTTKTGQRWEEHNFAARWRAVRRKALEKGVRPLKFHCARHTFITWALEAGTPAKIVSEWVGASVAVLEKHYAHVMPRADEDLAFTSLEVGGDEVVAPGRAEPPKAEDADGDRGVAAGGDSDREGGA